MKRAALCGELKPTLLTHVVNGEMSRLALASTIRPLCWGSVFVFFPFSVHMKIQCLFPAAADVPQVVAFFCLLLPSAGINEWALYYRAISLQYFVQYTTYRHIVLHQTAPLHIHLQVPVLAGYMDKFEEQLRMRLPELAVHFEVRYRIFQRFKTHGRQKTVLGLFLYVATYSSIAWHSNIQQHTCSKARYDRCMEGKVAYVERGAGGGGGVEGLY